MSEYQFTLKFRLAHAEAAPGQFVDTLFQAGCDDATIGIRQRGRVALQFAREAESALDAIASALEAVRNAIPGATLVDASPDFVGLTELADMIGCSRQNMRKLMIRNPTTFPDAVHKARNRFGTCARYWAGFRRRRNAPSTGC